MMTSRVGSISGEGWANSDKVFDTKMQIMMIMKTAPGQLGCADNIICSSLTKTYVQLDILSSWR